MAGINIQPIGTAFCTSYFILSDNSVILTDYDTEFLQSVINYEVLAQQPKTIGAVSHSFSELLVIQEDPLLQARELLVVFSGDEQILDTFNAGLQSGIAIHNGPLFNFFTPFVNNQLTQP